VEVVLVAQREQHAAEVLADEFGHQGGAGIVGLDVVFGEDGVGELGAGREGEGFGEDEGVVAVEEEGGDLRGRRVSDGTGKGRREEDRAGQLTFVMVAAGSGGFESQLSNMMDYEMSSAAMDRFCVLSFFFFFFFSSTRV